MKYFVFFMFFFGKQKRTFIFHHVSSIDLLAPFFLSACDSEQLGGASGNYRHRGLSKNISSENVSFASCCFKLHPTFPLAFPTV